MSSDAPVWRWLEQARHDVVVRGLVRRLDPGASGLLDVAGNDYLGLSTHPAVVQAAVDAARRHGAGSTGSRLVTGTTSLHLELEAELAARTGAETALVFSSGYLANLGALTVLAGPGVLVVSDSANHASLVDGCRLARAQVRVVPHGDVAAVEQAVADWPGRSVVVTDAVFSVDGAVAPLAALHAVVRRHGAILLVDEAHALGVLGPDGAGACAAVGLHREDDVVRTVTLSKSLGSQGGAVLGSALLRDHLVDTARAFVFDTGLAPAAVGAALAALRLVDDARIADLTRVSRALALAVGVPVTAGAVVQVPVGDPVRAVAAQLACRDAGVRVGCFRPPSVPEGGACLRLTARADLTDNDVQRVAAAVRAALAPVPPTPSPAVRPASSSTKEPCS
ncbi:MAG: 8-amino-7-oxononanoate synthase [Frankiales bacterium]|nr:8-amino-7-oxononanoate synthase [Frankiales bacterium]